MVHIKQTRGTGVETPLPACLLGEFTLSHAPKSSLFFKFSRALLVRTAIFITGGSKKVRITNLGQNGQKITSLFNKTHAREWHHYGEWYHSSNATRHQEASDAESGIIIERVASFVRCATSKSIAEMPANFGRSSSGPQGVSGIFASS